MQEEWKDVKGYEDYFRISNLGNVFSKRTNKILKPHIHKNGYILISTRIGGRQGKAVCFKVHRLVAEAFLPEPSEHLLREASKTKYGKVCVNHKDGNKQNNLASNLEWNSHSENVRHAYTTGLAESSSGEDNWNTKLSKEAVSRIRGSYIPYCRICNFAK